MSSALLKTLFSAFERTLHLGHQSARDRSCMLDMDAAARGLPLPPGLTLQWLGTAGFALNYQDTVLVLDPYISRADFRDSMFGRTALPSHPELIDRCVPQADAVIVSHTHFDHALDVPLIARKRGCKVYGSHSLAHLMGLYGLADRSVQVEHGRTYGIGPFEVTFFDSLHAKLLLGYAVPNGGELTCDHVGALCANNFRCGQVFATLIAVAGVTFFHLGSAELREDAIPQRPIDYLLPCIAGRSFSHQFTRRALHALKPHYVLPHHYDDFFQPLEAELDFSFNVNLSQFLDEVSAVSGEFAVRSVPRMQRVRG
jgi:L-ascorbate metabolism protein UlaG (beta-lactamase superfamily)